MIIGTGPAGLMAPMESAKSGRNFRENAGDGDDPVELFLPAGPLNRTGR
jgi:hypothetical protein